MDFTNVVEEKIVLLAKDGNAEAMEFLFNKYKNTVKAIARSYYIVGGDEDDLIQQGMIGVFLAVKSYNGVGPFAPYVFKGIKNRIIDLIRQSNQKKHAPLYNYISLSSQDDADMLKSSITMDDKFEPEREYINKEEEHELKIKIKNALSNYENEVLSLYLEGYSYDDISGKMGKNHKSIDNALQRIKKKIQTVLENAV